MKSEITALPPLQRTAELVYRAATKEGEDDTVALSFSSEEPYERWFGIEILGHKDGEVDMSWIASGRAPLLVDHKKGVDDQVGIITEAKIEGGRATAIARFGKDKRSQKIAARVKAGDLTNISVGYRVKDMELVKSTSDGPDTYRVTNWQPMEVSIVSIPADPTVGVGRKASKEEMAVKVIDRTATPSTPAKKETIMEDKTKTADAGDTKWLESDRVKKDATVESPEQTLAAERKRIADITAMGKRFNRNDLAEKHIQSGTSVAAFNGVLLEEIGPDTVAARNEAQHKIGLTTKEARNFSFMRMIAALDRNATPAMRKAAAFELAAVEAATEKRGGKSSQGGVAIPMEVLRTPLIDAERAMNVGTATAGGNLVATNLLAADFITLLRNKMMVQKMGAMMLSGLEGFVAIPRQSGGGTVSWVGEGSAPGSATQQTVDQVSLSPTTIAAYTDLTRRLLLQSSIDAEAMVRNDLALIIALGIDLAALSGSGSSNQPLGISGQSGVTSIALGANGANPAWADIVNMETQVAANNADLGNMGYISNPKVRGKLKGTLKAAAASATMIWDDEQDAQGLGQMNGYKAGATNQARSNLTKGTSSGVCSEIFFGNWNDLIIGQWSGLDLLVDPYTNSNSGTLRLNAYMDVAVAVRHGQSFSYIADALTT